MVFSLSLRILTSCAACTHYLLIYRSLVMRHVSPCSSCCHICTITNMFQTFYQANCLICTMRLLLSLRLIPFPSFHIFPKFDMQAIYSIPALFLLVSLAGSISIIIAAWRGTTRSYSIWDDESQDSILSCRTTTLSKTSYDMSLQPYR